MDFGCKFKENKDWLVIFATCLIFFMCKARYTCYKYIKRYRIFGGIGKTV